MQQHNRILGYILIILGVLELAALVVTWLRLPVVDIPAGTYTIVVISFVATVVIVAFLGVTAWAILTCKSWARTTAVVASVLSLLILFPLGLAAGIYGLWATLSAKGREDFRHCRPAANG